MELNRNSLRGASLGRVSLRGVSLIGRTGDEPAQDFEGYPLAIDIASAKRTQSYIIYGNTGENAQGVGRELLQLVPENLAPVTSRGFVFSIENNTVKVHGTRTQEGEIVNKYGSVKAGHKYLYYDYWGDDYGWQYCTQLWASGHDALYIYGKERVFTAPVDMDAYLQIDRRNIIGISLNFEHIAPLLIDLTAAGWEDITTGNELAERMGYKFGYIITAEHRIPYGSSFVAPIRVSSAGGDTLYPSVLSSPLHKIGDIVDYKESNGKEWHGCVKLKIADNFRTSTVVYYKNGAQSTAEDYDSFAINATLNRTPDIEKAFINTTGSAFFGKFASKEFVAVPYKNGNVLGIGEARCFNTDNYGAKFGASTSVADAVEQIKADEIVIYLATPTEVQGEPLPRLAIPKGESIVTLDTAVEPSNITAKV